MAVKVGTYSIDRGGADVRGDGGGVAEVGVDAGEKAARAGLDALDDDVALALLVAVAAGAVELAEVGDLEAVDGDGADTVVLDDLVLGALGTTAGDGGVTVTLDRESVWGSSRRPPTRRWRQCRHPGSRHPRSGRHR